MAVDCHVRKLHIRTQDKTFVPRMRFVLEEALRTASFPGVPANGMVYVRMLDFGRHDRSVSSCALARIIDDLLRHTRPVIITENSPEHLSAKVVWFPDELFPYRLIIKLLSENHRPLSWYWTTAVKGWNPKLSLKQSHHLILFHVSKQKEGIRGMAFVLEPLLKAGTIYDIVHAIDPKDAARMLINMGLKLAHDIAVVSTIREKRESQNNKEETEAPLSVTPFVQDAVTKAVRMWSLFDARTMLISYIILVTMGKKPSPDQVNRLFAAAGNSQTMLLSRHQPVLKPENEVAEAVKKNLRHPEKQFQAVVEGGMNCTTDIPVPIPGKHSSLEGPDQENIGPVNSKVKADEHQDGHVGHSLLLEKEIKTQADQEKTGEKVVISEDQMVFQNKRNEQEKRRNNFLRKLREHDLLEKWPLFGGFAGELSVYAGFIFLIPLLNRLGLMTLIEIYPEYQELNLPERILFRCAERFNIPPYDPALNFLGEKPGESEKFVGFTAPPEWRAILFSSTLKNLPFRMGRVMGLPGYRLILDEKERLILGLWHPKNRALIAPWLEASQKPFLHTAPQSWSIDRLVDNMVFAMELYVRKYAAMGLFELIRRTAYLATTRTHLDVSISFNRLDIRVRMAGLDINPGWVPWLGRVIQFHYVGGEN